MHRFWLALLLLGIFLLIPSTPTSGCCPAGPTGKPVVNADQTVIILWDSATKTEHFIRQASFQSEADDFGFIVPSPSQPELEESGNETFSYLGKLTEPQQQTVWVTRTSFSCSARERKSIGAGPKKDEVAVLQEKTVAGFNAVVLEAGSASALTAWLKERGYAYSREIEAWAKPYVDANWKFTALKIAKENARANRVETAALRISFKTDHPLFPYREPDLHKYAAALNAKARVLRIYLLAETRYRGELTKEKPWTGETKWAKPLSATNRAKILELLKLNSATGPATWWLTEFEDNWRYQQAPADVTFSPSPDQSQLERAPIPHYVETIFPTDISFYLFLGTIVGLVGYRLLRKAKKPG